MLCALCLQAAADAKFNDYKPKVAFFFPGQGAQTVGMCKEVTAEVPAAKELFDRASEILGYDLLQVCVEGACCRLLRQYMSKCGPANYRAAGTPEVLSTPSCPLPT